jgi:hypothetical protein
MTLEQINRMLTHLPVDLTFVDENDRVIDSRKKTDGKNANPDLDG